MNPPVVVSFINKSKYAIPLADIVSALGKQLARDFQPVWGRVIPSLQITKNPHKQDSQIVLFDDADQAGALGYHDETPDGVPYGKVFVHTIMMNGGTLSTGANSVSVTMSHELLELIGDASANYWADAEDGYQYALELCDAVEGDSYDIDGVAVSNFVYPAYFDWYAQPGDKLDHLGFLKKPFTMTEGGYLIRRSPLGVVDNVFADQFPDWKMNTKAFAASRTTRRQ